MPQKLYPFLVVAFRDGDGLDTMVEDLSTRPSKLDYAKDVKAAYSTIPGVVYVGTCVKADAEAAAAAALDKANGS